MKKALDGYVDISSLTNVQKDCLIAIAKANGYDTTTNNQDRTTLALYSELNYCLVQTLSTNVEQFTLRSRPIISIEDFLRNFAPEWSTGVCTNESLEVFWWVNGKDTFQAVDKDQTWKFSNLYEWEHLQVRRLFSIPTPKIKTGLIPADKLVGATMTVDRSVKDFFADAVDHPKKSGLESYKDFCKNFGGTISVNDEYYTYYTDGDEYYEFTSLEEFEDFLHDYQGFFSKYSGDMKR